MADIQDGLNEYFKEENKVLISRLPEVLVVDLKRFYYDVGSGTVAKVFDVKFVSTVQQLTFLAFVHVDRPGNSL